MNRLEAIETRQPAVAGSFYPSDPDQLRAMVRQFLAQAPAGEPLPCAMVAPHAGYQYSGLTAAYAYRTLSRASQEHPLRVFLLSPSHRVYLEGISVGHYRAYATPLGDVLVDQEMVQRMAALPDVSQDLAPHQPEHALEVHLPFLLETVGFIKLVPIIVGDISGGHLADILCQFWQPGDLLIASSDLSHFHSHEKAQQLDAECHQAVLTLDPPAMAKAQACGNIGMSALLEMGRRFKWRPVLSDYRTSGDTAGSKERVVGYGSYLFYPQQAAKQNVPLSLPKLARNHLEQVLSGRAGLQPAVLIHQQPHLAKDGACFVTLNKQGQLRGCIGSLQARRSLVTDLLDNSVSAATRDPRFPPVTAEELTTLTIEVSILSAAQAFPYSDGEDLLRRLQPGVHGVILFKGQNRSTFLPQVWEQLPNPRDFLQHLCQKAGLNSHCWMDKPDIFVYTVEKLLEH